MPITAPRSGGDKLPPADVVTHLLLVKPTEFRPDVQTKDYGLSDAIQVDVCDLDAESGPTVYRDALWFNKMLLSGLKKQIGEVVLGWMDTGVAKGKQDPPYMLVDATGDAAAMARGTAWLAANPQFEGISAPTQPDSRPAARPTSNGGSMPARTGSMPATAAPAAAPAPTSGVTVSSGQTVLDALSQEQKDALKALGYPVPQ